MSIDNVAMKDQIHLKKHEWVERKVMLLKIPNNLKFPMERLQVN